MDIIPKFYIFGVPDGFDMLGGTSAEITYFQKFYNGSTENAKFSIHRDAKGNITYTYLRYNLSSCKSRTGSFFGMSLIFNGVYCANPLRLYELFDWVYNTYVVSDKGFISPVNGSKDIQARYEIARFQDKSDYIQHYVEAVLLGNINKEFSNEFYSIDRTFSNERPNLVVQEPMQSASNERLLADLRQYNRVAVSPDWLPQTPPPGGNQNDSAQEALTVVLAPEYIVSLLEYTKGYQNYIIDSLNDIGSADIDEAKTVYREVAARLKEVKTTPSSDKRVSQIIRDYTTLTEQLQNLIQKIEEGPTHPPQPPIPPTPPTPWWKNPKILGIMGVAVIVVITLVSIIVINHNKQKEKEKATQEEQVQIIADVRKYIDAKDFQKAKKLVWKIDEPLCTQLADSIVFCELNDITGKRGFQDYTSTWKKYKEEFSGEYLDIKQMAIDTIANRRWQHIENLVSKAERATTNASKKSAKETAENAIKIGEDTELHNNDKAQEFRSRLNKIQIVEVRGTTRTDPRSTTPPPAPQYTIQIWKTDFQYHIEGNYAEKRPDYTISTSRTIELEKNSYYSCQVLHNGSTFKIKDVVKTKQHSRIAIRDNDWIRILVPDSGLDGEYVEIIGTNLKVTFKTE